MCSAIPLLSTADLKATSITSIPVMITGMHLLDSPLQKVLITPGAGSASVSVPSRYTKVSAAKNLSFEPLSGQTTFSDSLMKIYKALDIFV